MPQTVCEPKKLVLGFRDALSDDCWASLPEQMKKRHAKVPILLWEARRSARGKFGAV